MSEWDPKLTRASKFLSLVLRHDPSAADLQLDPNGWASVDELLASRGAARVRLSHERLERIVLTNPKQRFQLDAERQRIRAVQGHSVDVDLEYEPKEPPAVLYHGTHPEVTAVIFAEGLTAQRRRHVHLSADVETARIVGARRGRPVVLRVDAGGLHRAGAPFWRARNGVWLCEAVPPSYLRVLEKDAIG